MSRRDQREKERKLEPPRPIRGGRPVYEVRCFGCGRKLAEVESLIKKGVRIKCRCKKWTLF